VRVFGPQGYTTHKFNPSSKTVKGGRARIFIVYSNLEIFLTLWPVRQWE